MFLNASLANDLARSHASLGQDLSHLKNVKNFRKNLKKAGKPQNSEKNIRNGQKTPKIGPNKVKNSQKNRQKWPKKRQKGRENVKKSQKNIRNALKKCQK